MSNMIYFEMSPENNFTKAVREAVNDELFWRNMLDKYNLSRKQEKSIKKIIQEQLDIQIPSYVYKNLTNQFPIFLNNNFQLTQILQEHEKRLGQSLTLVSKKILDKISNEEEYHYVTNSYLHNINLRVESKIRDIENCAKKELEEQKNVFNQFLSFTERKINEEIDLIKKANEKLKKQEKDIQYIKYGISFLFLTGFVYTILK